MGKQSQIGDALVAPIKSGMADTSEELEQGRDCSGNIVMPVDLRIQRAR
jgi:hypothetical protein